MDQVLEYLSKFNTGPERHVKPKTHTSTRSELIETLRGEIQNWLVTQWAAFQEPIRYQNVGRIFTRRLKKLDISIETILDAEQWQIRVKKTGGRVIYPLGTMLNEKLTDALQLKPELKLPRNEEELEAGRRLVMRLMNEGIEGMHAVDAVREAGANYELAMQVVIRMQSKLPGNALTGAPETLESETISETKSVFDNIFSETPLRQEPGITKES